MTDERYEKITRIQRDAAHLLYGASILFITTFVAFGRREMPMIVNAVYTAFILYGTACTVVLFLAFSAISRRRAEHEPEASDFIQRMERNPHITAVMRRLSDQ